MSPVPFWVFVAFGLLLLVHDVRCFFLPNATHLESILSKYQTGEPHSRSKRAISRTDKEEILMLHNKLRGEVYPTASNMEYMVIQTNLFFLTAESWAHECVWDHGPTSLIMSIGQNLAVHWGRYRSPAFHVQSWYDEVKDYTYPYSHECNPWCPDRCSGAMCTHYTQIVWATTNKVGCAINVCKKMTVWGEVWENPVYLVCNYSPKGNWIGEAPYKHGRSCSECPPSYGGSCQNNLCYKGTVLSFVTSSPPPHSPVSSSFPAQAIKCDTKMRDKCKGSTCNSICRAAIHSGVLDNRGGLVDITRKGRSDFFVKSARNGVESLSGGGGHRTYCPAHCKDEPSYWAPVFGTNVYADSSSICKTAVHAGVIRNNEGGYVDVMSVDKKKYYVGTSKNGIQSEKEGEAWQRQGVQPHEL
uniref:Cysteine rich secretory protein LCCL domain containing 2 n=1 Tax=Sphenodon punctatus TaxID=8508 RepID=A0A8D0GST5_SPHPU